MRMRALLIGLALPGCSASTPTSTRTQATIAIVFSVGGTIYDVIIGGDTVLAPGQRVERLVASVARDGRDSSAIVVTYDSFANRVARRLSLRTGRVSDGASLSTLERSLGGDIPANLGFGESAALSGDGYRLIFPKSTHEAVPGVTAAKTTSWSVDWFVPALDIGGGAFGRWRGREVIFLAGRRLTSGPTPTLLWAMDPTTGQMLDSINLGEQSLVSGGGVVRVIYSELAARVLLQRSDQITSCLADLAARVPCTSITIRSTAGRLTYRRGDSVALVSDGGGRDGPGTGSIFAVRLDASSVDEHPMPLVNGERFVSQGVATTQGGSVWVVAGGTLPFAALFQPQPSVVLLYDPHARRVLKQLPVPKNEPVYFPVGL
jgi:hypothetical protein